MIRMYDELTETEQGLVMRAWNQVRNGLLLYEEITGAQLVDNIYEAIWGYVEFQKEEERRDEVAA